MPQKRNPISSEIMLAQSKILRAQAGLVLDGMVSDFERASGPWHLEWAALPVAFISAAGSLYQAKFALSGLQVNEDSMKSNLESTRGLIVAEAVMMQLAIYVGRQEAHELVYGACVSALDEDCSLLVALERIPEVTNHLCWDKLSSLCDPTNYLGSCRLMVDELLSASLVSRNGGEKVNGNGILKVNGVPNGH
jgi:adenylosuccinate lyase